MSAQEDRARENRIDIPICVAVFTLLVATTAVTARIYTRKRLLNQFGLDDGFAVAALVSSGLTRSAARRRSHLPASHLCVRLCCHL